MSAANTPRATTYAPDMPPAELYRQLNTDQAAAFLAIPKRNLEYMRQTGKGPLFVRVSPRNVRYRMIDLIRFQERRLRVNTISDDVPDLYPAA